MHGVPYRVVPRPPLNKNMKIKTLFLVIGIPTGEPGLTPLEEFFQNTGGTLEILPFLAHMLCCYFAMFLLMAITNWFVGIVAEISLRELRLMFSEHGTEWKNVCFVIVTALV